MGEEIYCIISKKMVAEIIILAVERSKLYEKRTTKAATQMDTFAAHSPIVVYITAICVSKAVKNTGLNPISLF